MKRHLAWSRGRRMFDHRSRDAASLSRKFRSSPKAQRQRRGAQSVGDDCHQLEVRFGENDCHQLEVRFFSLN